MAAVLAAMACARPAGPVRIGVAFPGQISSAAFLAAEQINAAGGVRGRPIEIVMDTIPSNVEPADVEIERAHRLLARGPLVAVIGHASSRGSLAAAPVYNDAGIPQVVPIGTSRLLREAGPWTLRMAPDDSVEGGFIASFIRDRLRARSVVIFHISDEYGVGIRAGLRAALAGSGVRILREQRFDLQSDIEPLVDAAFRGEKADVAVVAGRTVHSAAIARRLHLLSPRTRVVSAEGASILPGLAELSGPAGEGMHVVSFWIPGPADTAGLRFVTAFRGRLGRDPTAGEAMLFDAVNVVAAAVAAVGDDPAAVRGFLQSLGVSRPASAGVTGPITFADSPGSSRFVMGVIRAGRIVRAEAEGL